MNYAKIKYYCISNGPGIRTALFVQGCPIHCPGCFNKDTWDFNGGKPFTDEIRNEIFRSMNEHIAGLSILGGEPLSFDNYIPVKSLVAEFNYLFPDKSVWLWTGFDWGTVNSLDIMKYVDVCVAGPFVQEQRDLSLQYCGSRNQAVIDVKQSLYRGKVVLYK